MEYQRGHYKRVPLELKPDFYSTVKKAADEENASVAEFIRSAISTALGSKGRLGAKQLMDGMEKKDWDYSLSEVTETEDGYYIVQYEDKERTKIMEEMMIEKKRKHPETCYVLVNESGGKGDCGIVKWNESGYYKTDYPKGAYTQEDINELNERGGITKAESALMKTLSMSSREDWEEVWYEFLPTYESKLG